MPTKTVTRTVKLYIDNKEIDNSVSSIKAEVKQLTAEMNKMTIGTDEYNAHMRKISQLNGILDKHKSDLRGVGAELDKNNGKLKDQGSIFSSISSNIGKYATLFTGFFATLTAGLFTFNNMRQKMMEKESSAANLKALTGLDDNSIAWLTKQAEILSTTMDKSGLRIQASAKDILDAYTLVGSAKPELLNDKEALNKVTVEALRMAAASKMDVKDAVEGLTLAMNQYGAASDQAAKYVNVLAAGAKFGSAEIANQTVAITKAGVAASTANIPIEGLVGTIQTLAEKGIKDEVAGTGLKTFFLKLEAGSKETRPSVVGLQTALERLKAAHLDASKMVDMFGLETYTVAQALIANADKVDYYTKAVTGTNAATEQAAINSNTAAAKYAQMKESMLQVGENLAQKLDPVFSESISLLQKLIQSIPIVIDWLIKNKTLIFEISGTIVACIAVKKIQYLWDSRQLLLEKMKAPLLAINTAAMRALNIMILAYNGTITKSVAVQQLFNNVLKINPYVALTAAIGTVVAALIIMRNSFYSVAAIQKDMADINQKVNEKINDEEAEIKTCVAIVKNQTVAENEKKEALKTLNGKLMEAHLNNISMEDVLTGRANKTLNTYISTLRKRITMEAYQEKYTSIVKEQLETQNEIDRLSKKYNNANPNTYSNNDYIIYNGATKRLNVLEQRAKYVESLMGNNSDNLTLYKPNDHSNKNTSGNKSDIENKNYWDETLKSLTAQYEALSSSELKSKKGLELAKRISEAQKEIKKYDLTDASQKTAESAAKKETQKKLDAIDAEYTTRQNKLAKDYIASSEMTQQEYQDKMERIELDSLERKLKIAGLEPKKIAEINQQIMQAKVKLTDKLKELMKVDEINQEDNLNAELDANKKKYDDNLALLDYALQQQLIKQKEYEKDKAKITSDYDKENKKSREKDADAKYEIAQKGYSDVTIALRKERIKETLTDAQYDKKSKDARMKFLKDQLNNENLSTIKRQEITSEANDIELQQQEEANIKKQELQNQYNQIIQDSVIDMGKLIGEQIGTLLKDGTINFKDFLRGILTLIIDSVEKAILAARAASLARNLSTLGFAGLATWGLETALMTAAFELAKSSISNFYEGGFTPSGDWNKPQGIVHSNEFVANRFATSNQSLLPVLNLIDAAQKTGSVSNLTSSDIAAVLPYSSRSNASTVINNNNSNNVNMLAMASLLSNVHKSLQLINKRFSVPIVTETYASGKHGTIEATDLVNKMIKNATRNA